MSTLQNLALNTYDTYHFIFLDQESAMTGTVGASEVDGRPGTYGQSTVMGNPAQLVGDYPRPVWNVSLNQLFTSLK